ncbi:MAG: response regulator [Anaerolineae bacterium]|nr:response regulator [Anaerolineae bacterium]
MTIDLPIPPPESFERQVRDCLAHLYDFSELQSNPLSSQIAPELMGLQRVQMVRRILIETVEQLKGRETAGIPSRQERVYSLLSMRYLEGLPIQEVLQQLVLSERQFYREHQRAIQAVSQLLWDRLNTYQSQDSAISVKSEMQRLSRQSTYARLEVEALLADAITANVNLAEHHQVSVHLRTMQGLEDFNAHQAVLRQTIIWMLSQIITHVAAGSEVALSAAVSDHNLTISFEISGDDTNIVVLRDTLTDNATASEFLATLRAAIAVTEAADGSYLVQFQLPRVQRQIILVIDDNPDAVALLERYVTDTPYEIVSANDPTEGFRLAQNLKPSWIVLDIMLPHIDGWKMLQNLKSHPHTQPIPVLVCSVLDNPDLALSLGADAYLRKPPDRLSFLQSLQRWTASEH